MSKRLGEQFEMIGLDEMLDYKGKRYDDNGMDLTKRLEARKKKHYVPKKTVSV
tara:strand:- start:106 stop:264 length:159 start_codon:yes stop_codon:yes gene_type:complete